jgi:hypothetical protein
MNFQPLAVIPHILHSPEILLFFVAGVSSIWIAYLLARRKWDGLLQWLLVAQNLFIAAVMFFRTVELFDKLESDVVQYLAAVPFFLIQTWLAYYLYTHTQGPSNK